MSPHSTSEGKVPSRLTVPAVERRDLAKILEPLGILEPLAAGAVQCQSCSNILTINTVGAVLVQGSELLLFCNLADCIEEASRRSTK